MGLRLQAQSNSYPSMSWSQSTPLVSMKKELAKERSANRKRSLKQRRAQETAIKEIFQDMVD